MSRKHGVIQFRAFSNTALFFDYRVAVSRLNTQSTGKYHGTRPFINTAVIEEKTQYE
jgi:hypothetical protein